MYKSKVLGLPSRAPVAASPDRTDTQHNWGLEQKEICEQCRSQLMARHRRYTPRHTRH